METHTQRMAHAVHLPIRIEVPPAFFRPNFFRRLSRKFATGGAMLALLASLIVPHDASAVQAIPVGDAYVHTSFANPLGKKGQLRVNARSTSYFQFDVTTDLPDNATADQIEKATLKFFLRRVPRGGALHLATVEGPWNENNLKFSNAPTLSGPISNGTLQVDATDASQFILIDVTDIVKGWIANPSSNNG